MVQLRTTHHTPNQILPRRSSFVRVTVGIMPLLDPKATIMTAHNYTHTPSATVAAALHAGVDLDCGSFIRTHLPAALADGSVSASDVDAALLRLLNIQVRLGLLDGTRGPSAYNRIQPTAVHSRAHLQLALEASQQALVLLKNDPPTLPLTQSKQPTLPLNLTREPSMKIAVIGSILRYFAFGWPQTPARINRIHHPSDSLLR
jgi:beta-glucosidase-like glycosyl hydrolase